MKDIFKRAPTPTADLVGIIVIVLTVFSIFLPNNYFLKLDDSFFLPERAYFSNNCDWLKHLLSFAQSRFTWVGDYMCFRPGLFFVNWLFDVFARHDRALLHAISLGSYALASILLYLVCSHYVKRIVALGLCGIFIVPRYTESLANWPHINPYLFAMIFLMAGALIFNKFSGSQNIKPRMICSTFLFFLASLFHEYVVLTLAFSTVLLFFLLRKKAPTGNNDSQKPRRDLLIPFLVSASLFLILLLVNWTHLKPPSFYTLGENMSSVPLSTLVLRYILFIYKTVNFVLPDIIIKKSYIYNGVCWLPILIVFTIVFFRTKSFTRFFWRNNKIDGIAVLSFSAVSTMLLGILFGRFLTQGGAMEWYIAMIGYFLLVLLAIIWSRVSNKIPTIAYRLSQIIFVTLAVVTMVHRGISYHNNHKAINRDIQPAIKITQGITDFIERNPSYSYAGLFSNKTGGRAFLDKQLDVPNISNIARSINLVLYYYSSAVRTGTPIYAEINDMAGAFPLNGSIDLCQMNYAEKIQNRAWIALCFLPQKIIPSGDTIGLLPRTFNVYEVRKKLTNSRMIKSLFLTEQHFLFQELHVQFRSFDEFPVMYNVGIVYRSDSAATTVALVDNEAVIYSGLGCSIDILNIVTQGTLPRLPRLFSIVLRRNGPDCLVFMDEYLVAVIPKCDTNPGRIGIATWENGTPAEIVADAKIFPLKGPDGNKFTFTPIKRIYLEGVKTD